MNKLTKLLLASLVLLPALCGDTPQDNQVNINTKGNSGYSLVKVLQSSIDPGPALLLKITCDDKSNPIGFATDGQAVENREHTFYDQGKFSCIYLEDISGSAPINIISGRHDSTTVANMLSDLAHVMHGGNAAIVLSNKNAFNHTTDDCNNPIMAGGFPIQLNFFVLLKLQFQDSDLNNIYCDNIVLAQQGNEPYKPKLMHQILSTLTATYKLADKVGEIVATDDSDPGMWVSATKSFTKAVSGAVDVVVNLATDHNPWWITQLYPIDNTRLSFTLDKTRGAYGPGADLNIGQDRTSFMCSGDNNTSYLLMVTEDTNSYENFSVELVPYKFLSDKY